MTLTAIFHNNCFLGDVRSLSPEKSPVAMKDIKWITHNSTVGFLVAGELQVIHAKQLVLIESHFLKGIWNNRFYSTTGALMTTCNRSSGQDMVVAGDVDGYLRLFR